MTSEQKRRISSIESKFSNMQVKLLTPEKDEILYRHNDPSDCVYLVLKGLIELSRGNERDSSQVVKIKNGNCTRIGKFGSVENKIARC